MEFPLAAPLIEGEIAQIPDTEDGPQPLRDLARLRGYRAMLFVPLMQQRSAVGFVSVTRKEPGPFDSDDVTLLKTFADQAAIAIENARLFNETQEALEQQKASGEVLSVISNSVSDAAPVFDRILDGCERLVTFDRAAIFLVDADGLVSHAATHDRNTAVLPGALVSLFPQPVARTPMHRAFQEERVVIFRDIANDPEAPWTLREAVKHLGNFSVVVAPMLWERRGIGAIHLSRAGNASFTEKEVALLKTFADQAVIAIQNARMFRETQEALQQQTATAEVLKVISRSTFDLQAVFDTLVSSAVELIGGVGGAIAIREGDQLRFKASVSYAQDLHVNIVGRLITLDRSSAAGRAVLSARTEYIGDADADPEFQRVASGAFGKSYLGVPLARDGRVEGALTIISARAHAFTQRHIELAQTFADQAVIAIENVRLFDEVQARTRDLTEALQLQTATAEALKVISRSAFDLKAVLAVLVRSVLDLCNAPGGNIHLRHGDSFRLETQLGWPAEFAQYMRDHPATAGVGSVSGRAILTGAIAHIPDVLEDPDYLLSEGQKIAGYRALLGVPLLRQNEVIGVFAVGRPAPGPFTQREIELVQTFADQAVIAIENVRLFEEVQARTRDLEEALQQQTATAEVLKAISRTAFDLGTVLETLVTTAARLCDAKYGIIFRRQGDVYRYAASHMDIDPAYDEHERKAEIMPGRGTLVGRVALENRAVEIADAWNDPEYAEKDEARIGNVRAMLGVPLMRNGEPIGAFALGRAAPVPFSKRQIELVTTFADQAVIAIENVRLFEEVQARTRDLSEALQLQTATSEVLKVISRSAFDLQAVFDTLIASAVELCSAFSGSICVRDGEVFRYTGSAGVGATPALHDYLAKHPATPGRGTMVGRVLLSGKVEHIRDRFEDKEYAVPTAAFGNMSRAFLGVPLLGKAGIEGALVLTREEPGLFADRQVEIVQTFADQAVIAIENVRLFDQVQARTKELAASLDDLRKAQDRLIQSEKLASLGQLTAGIAHEIKNPLNFVNNFAALSGELTDELLEVLAPEPLDGKIREEVDELTRMLKDNLQKVALHGKRANSIVKNMLLHSRSGPGEQRPTDINAILEESLNLAYHGARAEKPGFNITMMRDLDAEAGMLDVFPQEISRAFLNLISNGFYAAAQRKAETGDPGFAPTLSVSTKSLGDSVEIRIRDNGTGIPAEAREKIFNPFFTTKPAGEGTGLGLSMTHDIVVKEHGGTIDVLSAPGEFTEFRIVLPRAGGAHEAKREQ